MLTGRWSICSQDSSHLCCKAVWHKCRVSWGQGFFGIAEGFDIWQ